MTVQDQVARQPYSQEALEVIAGLDSDADTGLTSAEAAARLATFGPNEITGEKPPSVWRVALGQLRDPMNLMLVAVTIVSLLIGQVSTAIMVGLLIVLNVVLGSRQELKARASVDALSNLQVPQAKVLRDRTLVLVPAADIVPGDIVQLEAGDILPADGRIVRSATLEAQEAALTGESAPVSKDAHILEGDSVALGDRSNMLFQNTSVTRGTATMVVTETGMGTQMGQIATMLTSVTRTRSPLQKELDALTKVLGIIAWTAVAFIVIVGALRGMEVTQLLLLGTAMAISAIPTGLPAFVSGMLSYGAKQLAAAKAVVKNLTDVETLGATSAINTDKTGTLTMNQMMVSTIYLGEQWFTVEGEGYRKSGAILSVAGAPVPDFTRLALGLSLCSDATVADDGDVVGDPTEAALVVLAAKLADRRRGDATGVSPRCRGALRFGLQVHGHLPQLPRGGQRPSDGPRQGRARCRARPLHAGRWPAQRIPAAHRRRPRRDRGRERAHGREGLAGAGVRRPRRRRQRHDRSC